MGRVIHAEERFNERRRKAEEMRGAKNPTTELEEKTAALKKKLDASRAKKKTP